MLPKSKRLTAADFKSLRRGRTINAPHFLLRLFPAKKGEEKAAVIVSASAYKNAVDRNLLRRRMYHIIRAHPFALHEQVFTVTMKKGARDVPFKKLEEEFLSAFKQIH